MDELPIKMVMYHIYILIYPSVAILATCMVMAAMLGLHKKKQHSFLYADLMWDDIWFATTRAHYPSVSKMAS